MHYLFGYFCLSCIASYVFFDMILHPDLCFHQIYLMTFPPNRPSLSFALDFIVSGVFCVLLVYSNCYRLFIVWGYLYLTLLWWFWNISMTRFSDSFLSITFSCPWITFSGHVVTSICYRVTFSCSGVIELHSVAVVL